MRTSSKALAGLAVVGLSGYAGKSFREQLEDDRNRIDAFLNSYPLRGPIAAIVGNEVHVYDGTAVSDGSLRPHRIPVRGNELQCLMWVDPETILVHSIAKKHGVLSSTVYDEFGLVSLKSGKYDSLMVSFSDTAFLRDLDFRFDEILYVPDSARLHMRYRNEWFVYSLQDRKVLKDTLAIPSNAVPFSEVQRSTFDGNYKFVDGAILANIELQYRSVPTYKLPEGTKNVAFTPWDSNTKKVTSSTIPNF